ncbi:MAG: hypothetical protein ABJP34_04455 [Erythrobacter sp.]
MNAATRLFTSGLVAAALGFPSAASANSQCPAITAIVSGDPTAIEGVAASYNANGLIDVTKHGVKGALQDADDCELSSRSDVFELDCTWKFPAAEQKAAEARFDDLLSRLDGCLPSVLIAQNPKQYTDAIEPLREYTITVEHPSDEELDVRLELDRFVSDGDLWVNVIFSN